MSAREIAGLAFAKTFGGVPGGISFAPGRVNLIGDHVDYQDGLVLPMPLALGTAVAWRRRADRRIAVIAANLSEIYEFALDDAPPAGDGWHSLVHGMVSLTAQELGSDLTGFDCAIAGDLPRGSGLSSSASLCIATGHAMADAAGAAIDPVRMASLAQLVEHRFAGVACGIMDQMVIAAGEPGAAMLLDCRELSWRTIPIPKEWRVLIVQSGVTRELVEGAYNTRRQQCEAAARQLGVASLRDIAWRDTALSGLSGEVASRARHVVSEIARTLAAAEAIEAGDITRLGALMREAHVSMRDNFAASHPVVDRQVDWLNTTIGTDGGARMTGGGFGGAIVAVYHEHRRDPLERQIAAQFGMERLIPT